MTGMKLWDFTDEEKWKHDKFEDMTKVQDKSAPKTHHQPQRKNQSKDHSYTDTNQFGSLDNFGNPNNKTSRIVKGRGPVKYKSILKSNNLNPSSKQQLGAKLKESTSSSSSAGVSSRALATSMDSCGPKVQQLISTKDSLPSFNSTTSPHDIFMTRRSNEQYYRSNKYLSASIQQAVKQPVSLPNALLQRKTKMYQPYSIHRSDNRIPLRQLYPVIEQSPITIAIQVDNFGHDLVGSGSGVLQGAVRGSFQLGGSPSLLLGNSLLHPKLGQILKFYFSS